MKNDQWALVLVCAYVLLFLCVAVGVFTWKIKQRGTRPPMPFKLLRGPGETLRRRNARFHDEFMARLAGAALLPFGAACVVLWLIIRLLPVAGATDVIGLTAASIVFIGGFVFALRWSVRDLERDRNDRLGYLGELDVAEHLQPLLAHGYRVFHDVPAEGGASAFNLDHVAVGPNGVALIETKTRRKGRAISRCCGFSGCMVKNCAMGFS